jgi:hypothetical protein
MQEHTDIRDEFCRAKEFTVSFCQGIVRKLQAAAQREGREHPVPKLSERQLAKLAKEEAIAAAQAEQDREASGLAALDSSHTTLVQHAPSTGPAHADRQQEGSSIGVTHDTQTVDIQGVVKFHTIALHPDAVGQNGEVRAGQDDGTAEAHASAPGINTSPEVKGCTQCIPELKENGRSRKQARLTHTVDAGL